MSNGASFRKQSGRRDLPLLELRTHCISVRVNDEELQKLDAVRSRYQRGEALRMLSLSRLPATKNIPEVNLKLATDLARSFGNLSTIATSMRKGEYVDLAKIKTALADLQLALIGGEK